MKITVLRQTCCAADDQAGPLSLEFEYGEQAPFHELVEAIIASGFLQYSSSHTAMQGMVDGIPLVRVFSPYYRSEKPHFLIDPATPVHRALKAACIDFQF